MKVPRISNLQNLLFVVMMRDWFHLLSGFTFFLTMSFFNLHMWYFLQLFLGLCWLIWQIFDLLQLLAKEVQDMKFYNELFKRYSKKDTRNNHLYWKCFHYGRKLNGANTVRKLIEEKKKSNTSISFKSDYWSRKPGMALISTLNI